MRENRDIEDDICHLLGEETSCDDECTQQFIRGDTTVDIGDAIFTLSYLLVSCPAPTCLDAADANDDGALGIAVLSHLSAGAGDLPEPFGDCGIDATIDADGTDLGCESYEPCQ